MSKKHILIGLILIIPLIFLVFSFFTDVSQICSRAFEASQPQGSLLPCHAEDVVQARGFNNFYNAEDGFVVVSLVMVYFLLLVPSAVIVMIGNLLFSNIGNKAKHTTK